MNIVVIGSGNVASHFSRAFVEAGCRIIQVYSRTPAHARALASTWTVPAISQLSDIDTTADVYLVAVKDDALETVLSQLPPALNGIVLHTAGSVEMAVFHGYARRYGVLYPVQTFSKEKHIDFGHVPLAIEASDAETQESLSRLAGLLSGRVFLCNSEQRLALHAAAVFACNFTNHCYAIADDLLHEHRLGFDLIRPLIRETAEKVMQHKPREVQTGPAVRQDIQTMEKHMRLLQEHPDWAALYDALSRQIGRS
ncbi:Rossmann-like and DUF2520 domain-containing protein [Parapedobacter lycopersici]|uniref:Rossmann-like and DUF2520 domain-containing protein n=1 Tax=Parapedobacter lycopersici TaxID=1864939 RepID=UPI00214D550F|nr:DUF2520 domain-containing protein [Parapedobacter lycopersici]